VRPQGPRYNSGDVTKYIRYQSASGISYGTLDGDTVQQIHGGLFDGHIPTGETLKLSDVKLLYPCQPGKIMAVGLNYRSHLGTRPQPAHPEIFYKPVTALQNPLDPIVIPRDATDVHSEGEMVVVVGKPLRHASEAEAAGATLLQLDEPILSTGIADLAIGKQAVELIASSVHIPVCMHVCGNIANVIDEILKYNVTVLDFEFSNNQANLDIISRRDLTGKMLGYGCVDSSVDEVETVPEIRKRIEKAVEYFDPKILLIDPDCGMRMRSRESAYWKLKNMCDAAKEVRIAL